MRRLTRGRYSATAYRNAAIYKFVCMLCVIILCEYAAVLIMPSRITWFLPDNY